MSAHPSVDFDHSLERLARDHENMGTAAWVRMAKEEIASLRVEVTKLKRDYSDECKRYDELRKELAMRSPNRCAVFHFERALSEKKLDPWVQVSPTFDARDFATLWLDQNKEPFDNGYDIRPVAP